MSKFNQKESIVKFIELMFLFIIILGSIIAVFNEQEVSFIPIIGGCIIFSWLIYKKGLLGIQMPRDIPYAEKDRNKTYYHNESWTKLLPIPQQLVLKVIIGLVIFLVMLSIGTSVFFRIDDLGRDNFPVFITLCLMGLILVMVGLYSACVLAFLIKPNPDKYMDKINLTAWLADLPRAKLKDILKDPNTCPRNLILFNKKNFLPEELVTIFTGSTVKRIVIIGIGSYMVGGMWGLVLGFLTIEAVLTGFLFLPLIISIGRLEGKFFWLFTINQWFNLRNWDMINGVPLRSRSGSNWTKFKGVGKQLLGLIALLIIPISLGSSLLAILDFITGSIGTSEEGVINSIITNFLSPNDYGLIIVLLTFGPLLTLFTRPFSFVDLWLRQGFFEKIASSWDLHDVNDKFDRYFTHFRFPQNLPGMSLGFVFASVGILALLGFEFITSLFFTGELQFISETLVLGGFVNSIVFILSLVDQSSDFIEERTMWIFAEQGRRNQLDLINWSLYGEDLAYRHQAMDEYLAENPSNWGLGWFLKGINQQQYDSSTQITAYKRALAENNILLPAVRPIALNNLGFLLFREKRYEEAAEILESKAALNPKDAPSWYNLGNILDGTERKKEAEIAFTRATQANPTHAEAWYNLAVLAFYREDYTLAKERCLTALQHSPNDVATLYLLGRIYGNLDDSEKEIETHKTVLTLDPNFINALQSLSVKLHTQNRLDEAEELYRRITQLDPIYPTAWANLGLILENKEELTEAETTYLKAIELAQTNALYWSNYAHFLYKQARLEDAKEAFKKTVQYQPEDTTSWLTLAWIYIEQKNDEKALLCLQEVIKRESTNANALYNLACIYAKQGEQQEALNFLREAIRFFPDYAQTAKDDQDLSSLNSLEEFRNLVKSE